MEDAAGGPIFYGKLSLFQDEAPKRHRKQTSSASHLSAGTGTMCDIVCVNVLLQACISNNQMNRCTNGSTFDLVFEFELWHWIAVPHTARCVHKYVRADLG